MGKIVDFSHHQGNVNWSQASKELDLAIIRVQYGSNTIDRKYKEYAAECKKRGIPFGHYAYCQFVSVNDAIKEAEDFHKRADKSALFLVADVEEQTTKTKAEMAPATQAFIDTLKKKGWKVGLYSGHHTYAPLGMQKVKADFVWIPRYGNNKPAYPCDLWQHTETGRLAGVSGNVDLNTLTGSKPLSYFTGGSIAQSGKEVTLIDWMKSKGMDSSYKNREKLAAEYGINGYEGTAKQNLELFALLKAGKPKEDVVMQKEFDALKEELAELKKEVSKKQDKPLAGDVPDPTHAKNWEKATELKVVNGERPHEPLTREQFATIYIETLNKK